MMMTTGELKLESIYRTIDVDPVPFWGARIKANDDEQINTNFNHKKNQMLKLQAPDMERPLEWLSSALSSDVIGRNLVFEFHKDKIRLRWLVELRGELLCN